MNFVQGLEVKMTRNMGRGLFATRAIVKGELLIGEKAIAFGKETFPDGGDATKRELQRSLSPDRTIHYGDQTDLIKQCTDLSKLKGIDALRLSHLFDGSMYDLKRKPLPPLEIFVRNHYQQYEIPDVSVEKMSRIV